jgi:hypothetical protein
MALIGPVYDPGEAHAHDAACWPLEATEEELRCAVFRHTSFRSTSSIRYATRASSTPDGWCMLACPQSGVRWPALVMLET